MSEEFLDLSFVGSEFIVGDRAANREVCISG